MSVPANEPVEPQGNPAWQPILDALNEVPDDFRALVEPRIVEELKSWDQGVNGKLQDLHSQYDLYKPLLENKVPMERIEQALFLAHQIENNPQDVIDRAIKAYNLDYVPASQSSTDSSEDDDNEEDLDMQGLENHPAFKQVLEKAQQFEEYLNQQKQNEQQQTAAEQLDEYIKALHNDHGEFNDLYVTALMANGADPVEAIKEYQESVKAAAQAMIGQAENQDPPPIVMGEGGTIGSGVPQEVTNMGQLSDSQVEEMVANMIKSGNIPG